MTLPAIPAVIYLVVILMFTVLVACLVWKIRKDKAVVEPAPESEMGAGKDELAQLREQLSTFDQAMAQCPSSIIITDLHGNIQYVNARFSEVSGYAAEEVIGRNPRFLKSGNMEPEVYSNLWATISKGQVWRGDLQNRAKNGQLFWEHVSIAPIQDAQGEISRYFSVKEDITEAVFQQEEVRRARLNAEAADAADQAKAVFLKVIGQEMKNPLNRILGFTNLLSQSQLSNNQLKHLNQVGGAGLELLALIDRILDFTQAETGTMELESRPFKPAEVFEQLLKVYELKAAERNIVLHREISEAIPDYVIGDEKRFKQVLEPLLDNAVKFTSEGSIGFRLSSRFNDTTKVWEFSGSVTDTGRGIPSEKLEGLFNPFTQLEPGFGDGSGLGLAFCQRLCQLQGGLLSARSELGKGSTFSFEVKLKPMDLDEAAVQLAQGPEGIRFARAYPIDILIAEDNRINRRLLETLMERLGYQATFAVDGLGVMAAVRKKSYHLILMDLQMPNMSGVEAARRIRNGEAGDAIKDCRIVAITAFTTEENLAASREVRMDAFLAKPFDIAKIKLEIIHAYDGVKARKKEVT